MSTFGMPTSMFLVFVATILAGSLGAIHYVIVHVIMGKPFGDEAAVAARRAARAEPGPSSGPSESGPQRGPLG